MDLEPIVVSDEVDGYSGPVFTFCQSNDLRNIQLVYEKDNSVLQQRYGKRRETLLHIAAALPNRIQIVQYLLSKGASQEKDVNHNTPLHIACIRGGPKTVAALMTDEAAMNTQNIDGDLPIHVAAAAGNIPALRLLLEAGMDVNTPSYRKDTPLHAASMFGHTDAISLLINHGAEVAARNGEGETALHIAAGARGAGRKSSHVQALLDAGASTDMHNKKHEPVIFNAARTGTMAAFTLLLDRGCKVRKVLEEKDRYYEDTGGDTLLRCVLESGYMVKGKELLKRIMAAHYKVDSASSINALCRGRRECLLKTEVTPQEVSLSGMLDEVMMTPLAEDSVLRRILDSDSRLLECLLDECLYADEHRDFLHDSVTFNFFLFPDCDLTLLDMIMESGKIQLLNHPLIETFVEKKWFEVYKLFFFFFSLFSLYMVALLLYVLTAHTTMYMGTHQQEIRDGCWWALLVLNCIISLILLIKVINLVALELQKQFSMKNTKQRPHTLHKWIGFFYLGRELIGPVLTFTILFYKDKGIASLLILNSGYEFMMAMSRIPRVGGHVFITGKVFRTISEFFLSYLVIIFAFAVAFHIAIPEAVAFSNLGDSFIKVLTMLLGEFDFVDIIAEDHPDWVTRVVFVFFLVTMSIVLMNLVVGLAIGDIESMRKDANIHKLISTLIAIRVVDGLSQLLRKMSCFTFKKSHKRLNHASVPEARHKFELDLKEKTRCGSSQYICTDPLTGQQWKYSCSKRVEEKVYAIIHKRWFSSHSNEDCVTERFTALERKLEILTNEMKETRKTYL